MNTYFNPTFQVSQTQWGWPAARVQHTLDTPAPTTCLRWAALSFHSLASVRYLNTAASRHRESSNCQATGTPAETLPWWAQELEGTPEWDPILNSDWVSLRKQTVRGDSKIKARFKFFTLMHLFTLSFMSRKHCARWPWSPQKWNMPPSAEWKALLLNTCALG